MCRVGTRGIVFLTSLHAGSHCKEPMRITSRIDRTSGSDVLTPDSLGETGAMLSIGPLPTEDLWHKIEKSKAGHKQQTAT